MEGDHAADVEQELCEQLAQQQEALAQVQAALQASAGDAELEQASGAWGCGSCLCEPAATV
jgi:hypothetical protein